VPVVNTIIQDMLTAAEEDHESVIELTRDPGLLASRAPDTERIGTLW
jgi:hypothetical protein